MNSADDERKLPLAYALADPDFGQVNRPFLVRAIATAHAEECDNLTTALAHDREAAVADLKNAAAAATAKQDWKLKTRLAVVALYLNDMTIAAEMLRGEPSSPGPQPWDPIQRTRFIECFPTWSGSVQELAGRLRDTDNISLRSGICLAVGSVKEPSADAKKAWRLLWAQWHASQPDSGTHSATGWALRTGQCPLPEIPPQQPNPKGFDWQLTKTGLTMIRIRAGEVEGATDESGQRRGKRIRIPQDFWLSDREVTAGQFKQFLNDKDAEKPDKPEEIAQRNTGDPSLPVEGVNWYDAVMFCNWLSRQEGRDPCYQKEGKEQIRDYDNKTREYDAWKLIPGANGYRLPTEDEWEYACRARTTTAFSFGDAEDLLDRYAVFVRMPRTGRIRWGVNCAMRGDCSTCTATYGVVPGLVHGGLRPRAPGRLLVPPCGALPVGIPQQEPAERPHQPPGLPRRHSSVSEPSKSRQSSERSRERKPVGPQGGAPALPSWSERRSGDRAVGVTCPAERESDKESRSLCSRNSSMLTTLPRIRQAAVTDSCSQGVTKMMTREVRLRRDFLKYSALTLAGSALANSAKAMIEDDAPGHASASPSTSGQDDPQEMRIQQVIDLIIRRCVDAPLPNTVDTVKTGDPSRKVAGIVTTFMATREVIGKAIHLGANFIITHEPTFWSHTDETQMAQE